MNFCCVADAGVGLGTLQLFGHKKSKRITQAINDLLSEILSISFQECFVIITFVRLHCSIRLFSPMKFSIVSAASFFPHKSQSIAAFVAKKNSTQLLPQHELAMHVKLNLLNGNQFDEWLPLYCGLPKAPCPLKKNGRDKSSVAFLPDSYTHCRSSQRHAESADLLAQHNIKIQKFDECMSNHVKPKDLNSVIRSHD